MRREIGRAGASNIGLKLPPSLSHTHTPGSMDRHQKLLLSLTHTHTHQVQGIGFKLRALPEAKAAMAKLTEKQLGLIHSAFNAFDEDGSGDISTKELQKAVQVGSGCGDGTMRARA